MDIIEHVILSDALATIPTEHLKSNQPHSLAPTQPMRYAREPDVITAAPRGTARIRSYWRGNSSGQSLVTSDLGKLRLLDVAMDGAGVRSAKDV